MITVGDVSTFSNPKCDKDQVNKILEEAAEVFGAWQEWNECSKGGEACEEWACKHSCKYTSKIFNECADVIQATCNLLAAMGIKDFQGYMGACKISNLYRGREYEGTSNHKEPRNDGQMVIV